jgi:steroid delta-isomerase-like uncharacterized protein
MISRGRRVAWAVLPVWFLSSACGGKGKPPGTPASDPADTAAAEASASPPGQGRLDRVTISAKGTSIRLGRKASRDFLSAIGEHDSEKIAANYAEEAVLRMSGSPKEVTGRDAIEKTWRKYLQALPDLQTGASRVWSTGDLVFIHRTYTATHRGELWGIRGSNRTVGAGAFDVLLFNAAGAIREHRMYTNGAAVLSQIGATKGPRARIPSQPHGDPQYFIADNGDEEGRNLQTVKSSLAAFETHREDDFAAFFADDVTYEDLEQPQLAKGKADVKKLFKDLVTAFPDMKATVDNAWAIESFVISERSWTGTHRAPFLGVAPTQKAVTTRSVDIAELKDGKVIHLWTYANGPELLEELGALSSPKAAEPPKKRVVKRKDRVDRW